MKSTEVAHAMGGRRSGAHVGSLIRLNFSLSEISY